MEVGEKVAQFELDSMTAKDIEEHIHVAAFLSTVNEPKQAKSLWEKKGTKAGQAKYTRATAEAEKELERIQKKNEKDKPNQPYNSDSEESVKKVREILPRPPARRPEQLTVRAIRSGC